LRLDGVPRLASEVSGRDDALERDFEAAAALW
jgi:hypothetical protein